MNSSTLNSSTIRRIAPWFASMNISGAQVPKGVALHGTSDDSGSFASLGYGVLWTLPIILGLLFYFGVRWRSWTRSWNRDHAARALQKDPELGGIGSESIFKQFFTGIPKMMSPYLFGHAWKVCWQHLGLSLMLLCATCYIDLQYNWWEKLWWDTVSEKDAEAMVVAIFSFCGLCIAWTCAKVFSAYARGIISIHWRDFQTLRLVRIWSNSHTHYIAKLKSETGGDDVDNPDQRIQEDINNVTCKFVELGWDLVDHILYLIVFAAMVYQRGPVTMFGVVRLKGWVLYFFIVYAFLGSWITQKVGHALVRINSELEKCEANFRGALLHISEYSESIAVYGAIAIEELYVLECFSKVKSAMLAHLGKSTAVEGISVPLKFSEFMLPFFVLIPSYLNDELTLGDIFQLSTALWHVTTCFDWFVHSYEKILEWWCSVERVLQLEDHLKTAVDDRKCTSLAVYSRELPTEESDKSEASGSARLHRETIPLLEKTSSISLLHRVETTETSGACVSVDVAHINVPTGDQLWGRVKLRFYEQQRVLISGGEGQGKSTLFRVLAGVWPHIGEGEIVLPSTRVLFVPQKPVLTSRCSLRAALSYPEPPGTYSDEELLHALKEVSLHNLVCDTSRRIRAPADKSMANGAVACCGNDGNARILSNQEAKYFGSHVITVDPDSGGQYINLVEGHEDDEDDEGHDEEQENEDEEEDIIMGEGLSRECNWMQRLSPGMQQRLVFGHIILRQPKVVFLDESTCHVTKNSAKDLYRCMFRNLPPEALVVTISHDVDTMEELHNTHYTIRGEGECKRLHLVKHKDIKPQPGRFVVILRNGQWDEVLLCAMIPGQPDHWLSCSTQDDGSEFKWAATELAVGKFFLVHESSNSRFVAQVPDDEVNWICTDPDCRKLWRPSPDDVKRLSSRAESLIQQLVDIPAQKFVDALGLAPVPYISADAIYRGAARPGSSALLRISGEWKEVLLCTTLDGNGLQWICYTTDEFTSAFMWSLVVLRQDMHHIVDSWSSNRAGPSHLIAETISWICVPPDSGNLWCPSGDEIQALIKESKEIQHRVGAKSLEDACTSTANPQEHFCDLLKLCDGVA